MQILTGTTLSKKGYATPIPLTALKTKVVGVSKPSAMTGEHPKKHAYIDAREKIFLNVLPKNLDEEQ